jgi:hypothetical protein
MGLPFYKCHKIVQAARVKDVKPGFGGTDLLLEVPGEGIRIWPVDSGWVERQVKSAGGTLVGGYLVVYGDSYQSWSPAKAFEEGYTLWDRNPDGSPFVEPPPAKPGHLGDGPFGDPPK